jgi:tripeptidyl-peptidase-1
VDQLNFEMAYTKALVAFVAFLAAVNAVAVPAHHEIHEKREFLHKRWTKVDRVESHKLFPMRIGLTQTNLEHGYNHLMDV